MAFGSPNLAQRGAEFPGLCLLFARDRKCTVEIRFRFRCIRLWSLECDFTGNAIYLGLERPFFRCFHRRQPLANTSAPIGERLRTEGRYLAS